MIKKVIVLSLLFMVLLNSPIAISNNPKLDVFNAFRNNNINTNGIEFTDEMYSYNAKDWDNLLMNNNVNKDVAGFVKCDISGVYLDKTYNVDRHIIMHEYLHTLTRRVICSDGRIIIAYEQITECLADRFFKTNKLEYNADETCKLLQEKFTTQQLFNFYMNLNYDKIKSLTQ